MYIHNVLMHALPAKSLYFHNNNYKRGVTSLMVEQLNILKFFVPKCVSIFFFFFSVGPRQTKVTGSCPTLWVTAATGIFAPTLST